MATRSVKSTNSEPHSVSRTTSYNRPKLLRSCVTAPTLVTSYASRNDRSSPNFGTNGVHSSSRDRATALLNRVASYNYACLEKSEELRKQAAGADKRTGISPGGRREAGESGKNKISMISLQDGGKHGKQSF